MMALISGWRVSQCCILPKCGMKKYSPKVSNRLSNQIGILVSFAWCQMAIEIGMFGYLVVFYTCINAGEKWKIRSVVQVNGYVAGLCGAGNDDVDVLI